jgi:tetratricopeptide (TPR) repeat protein
MRVVMELLRAGKAKGALVEAERWRERAPGDVLALVALGEALEALGLLREAARAYGAIIDLFPGRADLRRFAGCLLDRLAQRQAEGAAELAVDTFRKAREARPDHPSSHRMLAYALLRAGRPEEAFSVILEGARREYPAGRFPGVPQILTEDVGLIAAAWLARRPEQAAEIRARASEAGVEVPRRPSLRFVLTWETDANDVDFHIYDAQGGHAFYRQRSLPSGGTLYADVTTGYGPECFTIEGLPRAYPYRLQAHYFSRGPMGYGMGKLEVLQHDGRGGLRFDQRPYVIMEDRAFIDLGEVAALLR